jgi:hypothetical protein
VNGSLNGAPPSNTASSSAAAAATTTASAAESRALAADKAAAAATFAKESGLSPRTVNRLLAKVEERTEAQAEVQSVFTLNYSDYHSLPHKDRKLKLNMTRAPAPVAKRKPSPTKTKSVFSKEDVPVAHHRSVAKLSSAASSAGQRADRPIMATASAGSLSTGAEQQSSASGKGSREPEDKKTVRIAVSGGERKPSSSNPPAARRKDTPKPPTASDGNAGAPPNKQLFNPDAQLPSIRPSS